MPFRTERIVVRRVSDTRWALVEPVHYEGAEDAWTVPAGFVTDFASVPAVVRWLIPKTGRHLLASVLHDYLWHVGIPSGQISARDADGVFRRVLREDGVPPVRRWLMWAGVRWGALTHAARRAGWWRDAPVVVAITLLAAPVVVPAAALGLVGALLYQVVERLVGLFTR